MFTCFSPLRASGICIANVPLSHYLQSAAGHHSRCLAQILDVALENGTSFKTLMYETSNII